MDVLHGKDKDQKSVELVFDSIFTAQHHPDPPPPPC